jgi:UDP-glucose 4-epimerase
MRILITGGAGFIGSHLAERHLERGDEVYVLDDLSTGSMENLAGIKDHPRFHYHIDSVTNEQLTAELVDLCDVIYHLAAAVGVKLIVESPVRTIETNIKGTDVILRLAAKKGKRVLITSTSEVYGKQERVPFNEECDFIMGPTSKGRWSYACSKAIDEFLALAYWREKKLPTVVVRLFNTVGPRQTGRYGMVIPNFVRQALLGEDITVFGDGRQTRCFTHVSDAVGALMSLALNSKAVGEVYNIGNTEEVTILELAERIKRMTGSSSRVVLVPYEKAYEAGFEDMVRRVPDLSKIHALTGYAPSHSLDQILASVIEDQRARLEGRSTALQPQHQPESRPAPVSPAPSRDLPTLNAFHPSSSAFDGANILITGGTGSLGQRLVKTLLEQTRAARIVIFSRDELKQSQMMTAFAAHQDRLRFFLGDIRDLSRLQRAFHDVDIVIHAAALKQVPALEYNPFEAVQTNIVGTQNIINAAIDQGVKKVLLISTDKAANPANLYGATKLCAERLCVAANNYSAGSTRFSAVRYGNVLGSRGSLLTIIQKQRPTGVVTLTHEDMTRFWITIDQGVALVLMALERMVGGETFIPKIPSMKVKDLITKLAPECRLNVTGIRPGEKMHEVLLTAEEARRTREFKDHYVILPEFTVGRAHEHHAHGASFDREFAYTSDTNERWLDDAELKSLLSSL